MTPWTALRAGGFGVGDPDALGPPIACSGVGRAGFGGGSRSHCCRRPHGSIWTRRTFRAGSGVVSATRVPMMGGDLAGRPAHPRRPRCSLHGRGASHGRVDGGFAPRAGCLIGRDGLPFVTIVAHLFPVLSPVRVRALDRPAMTTAFGLLGGPSACDPAWLLARSGPAVIGSGWA